MPGVRVGRHARIRRAIIDRDVFIPRGASIGYNAEEDRKRHTVTEKGHRRRHHRRRAADRRSAERRQLERRSRVGQARQRIGSGRASAGAVQCIGATSDLERSTEFIDRGVIRADQVASSDVKFSIRAATRRSKSDVELDGRRVRPRGGAVGRVHRHARGARAARRRQEPLPRQGRAQGRRRTSTARSRSASPARSSTRRRSIDAMIDLDGTPNKGAPRRQRDCSPSRWPPLHAGAARSAGAPLYEYFGALRHARAGGDRADLLPVPMMNILNGGAHADTNVDFQEFMVMPLGAPSFAEALRIGAEIFHALRGMLKKRGLVDRRRRRRRLRAEPQVEPRSARRRARSHRQGRLQGRRATSTSRSTSPPASSWTRSRRSTSSRSRATRRARPTRWSRSTTTGSRQYPIISIEDGLAEADWPGWKTLTTALGEKVQLVGDDVFVTNPEILKEGIEKGIGNSLLVKLNQIGTVSETLDAMAMAWQRRLHDDRLAPLGRNRRLDDRRPRRRHPRRPDQDRLAVPQRPRRQVQPAAAHRRSARQRARSTPAARAIKQLARLKHR